VKAFKTFLKRNQELSRRQYGPYENLLMLARRAYRLKIRKGSIPKEKFAQKLDKLSQQVQRAQGVANLNWLKARLAELED
jgi:phosphodiesterase/alkaline phosphatase D-like protein